MRTVTIDPAFRRNAKISETLIAMSNWTMTAITSTMNWNMVLAINRSTRIQWKVNRNGATMSVEKRLRVRLRWSEINSKLKKRKINFTGGAESTGYITDEPGLENVSLLNEAGLTDAEGALSDVNSLYNAPDVDDTSISSRASSRLLSLDSLSGLYDCELDSKHEMAIVNVSNKITSKFGPPNWCALGGKWTWTFVYNSSVCFLMLPIFVFSLI